MAGFGGSVKLTGESEYRRALSQITQNLREVASEMRVVSTASSADAKSMDQLAAKQETLNKQLELQREKLGVLNDRYEEFSRQAAVHSRAHEILVDKYQEEKDKLSEIEKTLGKTSPEYREQEKYVAALAQEVAKSADAEDTNAKQMSKMRTEMNNAQTDINKTTKELDELGKETEESATAAQKSGDGFTVLKGILANLGTQAINAAMNGIKKLGGAVINLGKQAMGAYAEQEQLVGGIETLFGAGGAKNIQEYADSVGKSVEEVQDKYNALMRSQTKALDNAKNAYKTAGLSANEYMETITGFSATLIQGLEGDTEAAVAAADMAITDMSDLANKMGIDMSSIQNAYQGFAKDNYTMLRCLAA